MTETVQRGIGGRRFVGPPKSDAGQRRLSMSKPLSDLLAAGVRELGRRAVGCHELEAPGWKPAAIKAGLVRMVEVDGKKHYEGIIPHDLRRTNATAMVGADVDIKTAQARLGHSDVRMTLDLYARVLAQRDQGAADAVADALMKTSELG